MAEEGESFIAKIAAKVGGRKKLILILVAALIVLAAGGLALSILSRRASAETSRRQQRKVELPEGADYQNLSLDQLEDLLANIASSYPSAETPEDEAGFTHPIIQDIIVTEDGQPIPSGQTPPEGDVVVDPSQPEGNPPVDGEEEEPKGEPDVGTIFVTRGKWDGNLGGLSGADAKCQSAAEDAGFSGTWRALLSDSSTYMKDRIPDTAYKNIGGQVIANGKVDLFDASIANPIMYTDGQLAYGLVWTGSDNHSRGMSYIAYGNAQQDTCGNWTCNLHNTGEPPYCGSTAGYPDKTDEDWLSAYERGCHYEFQLYCIKTEGVEEEEEEGTPEEVCEGQGKTISASDKCGNDLGYSDPGPAGGDSHCQTQDCCSWYQTYHVHDLQKIYAKGDLIVRYAPGLYSGCTDTVTVEVSADDVTWSTVGTFSATSAVGSGSEPSGWWKTYMKKIYNVENFRYVKITVPECHNDYSDAYVCGGTEADEEPLDSTQDEEEKTPEQLCEEQEKAILYTEECGNDQGYSLPGLGSDPNCQTKDCCAWYQTSHVHDLVLAYSDIDLAVEYTPGFSDGCTDTVTVETSRDNVNWTTAKTFSTKSVNTCPDEGECWKTYAKKIHNVKDVRYVRVTIPECYNDYSAVHVCVPGPIIFYSGYVREGQTVDEVLDSLYTIRDVVEKYYPVIKDLYGPLYNFSRRHIRIQYDRDASPSYLPQYDLLIVNGDDPWDVVPGLVGVFHGEYAGVVPETWEYGMRYAVADLAIRQFPEDFNSDYGQFMDWVFNFDRNWYERYNVEGYPIWGASVSYEGDMLGEWRRTGLATVAMMKPYLYDDQFFAKLNQKLYEIPLDSTLYDGHYGWDNYGYEATGEWFEWIFSIYDDDYLLFKNVASAFPNVEGMTPIQWYDRQHVLHQTEKDFYARSAMAGKGQLFTIQTGVLTVYAFKSESAAEGMKFVGQSGLPLKIKVENNEGGVIKEADYTTDGDGRLRFLRLEDEFGIEEEKRYLVSVEAAEQVSQAHIFDEAWAGWGYDLFGVVTNFGQGKIKALDANQDVLEEVDIIYGAFDFDELFSGVVKLEVTDVNGDKVLEKKLAKDRGGYFAVLHSPTPSYPVECADSDGINYWEQGTVVDVLDGSHTDFCVADEHEGGDPYYLAEFSCERPDDSLRIVGLAEWNQEEIFTITYDCLVGCESGACMALPDGFTDSWSSFSNEGAGIRFKAPWGMDSAYTQEGPPLWRVSVVSSTDPLDLIDPSAKVSRFELLIADHDLKTDEDYGNWFVPEAWPGGSKQVAFKDVSAEGYATTTNVPAGPLDEGTTYPLYKEMYYFQRNDKYYLLHFSFYTTPDELKAENRKIFQGFLDSIEFL